MKNILKRDSMIVGVVVGFVCPAILFGILYFISRHFAQAGQDYLIKLPTLMLVSVFPNLFTLRHYLLKLKLDKTGRGILLITFVFAIFYFVFYLV